MITESVSGRSVLRYRGEPVPHDVRFYATNVDWPLTDPIITARCDCGWSVTIDGGHTAGDLARLARQHAGIEDPPEGTP